MEETSETFKESQKKPSRLNYMIPAVLLIITAALVYIYFAQEEPKPDPASENIIRQATAKEFEKEPNKLTDDDFAKIVKLNIENNNSSANENNNTRNNNKTLLFNSNPQDNKISILFYSLMKAFPDQTEKEYTFARNCLEAAINKSRKQIKDDEVDIICQEISRIGKNWKLLRESESFNNAASTIQVMIYWYLTPPDPNIGYEDLIRKQRNELLAIVKNIPKKLIDDFIIPIELEKDVNSLCAKGQEDFIALISSPFLISSQMPMTPTRFDEIKKNIEDEIERLSTSLYERLQNNIIEWNRVNAMRRSSKSIPGGDLLRSQYVDCKSYITFLHSAAMREYLLSHTHQLYKTEPNIFPFYEIHSYGMSYDIDIGWCFYVKTKMNIKSPDLK